MANNSTNENPATSFPEALRSEKPTDINECDEPTAAVDFTNGFRMALYGNGKRLGWFGENEKQWVILVTDVSKAVVLEQYSWKGVMYYRKKGSDRYLSKSNDDKIGFYDWVNARGFTRNGSVFTSDQNGQQLSYRSMADLQLYCWNDYTQLEVNFVPIEKPLIPNQPLTDLIEHIVVVMLENRSFDNVLGGLYPPKSKTGTYRGLKGDESNPDPANPGRNLLVFQGAPDDNTWIMPYPDPGEYFTDMNEQIFGTPDPAPNAAPTMKGFTLNYSKQQGAPLKKGEPDVMPRPGNIMQYYSEQALPVTYFLAKQYAVCDGWFAAGPVQTLANRVFAHCGTPGLVYGTDKARLNNPDFTTGWSRTPPFDPPVIDTTVFQLLDEAYPGEVNWKVYYHDAPISALCDYVYQHWSWFSEEGGNVFSFKEHFSSETNFEFDIKNGRLPKYSFIEPRYEDTFGGTVNSYHPGGAGIDFKDPNGDSLPPPISVKDGEAFLREVYEILLRYPETFKKTLLIVTYDEHGGLYDHIQPPSAVSLFAVPPANFSYNRYGVRVPAILINPCIPPGTVYPPRNVADQWNFDHTSLISTVIKQFGLTGSLTPRSDAAPTLKELIPFNHTVYPRPAPPAAPGEELNSVEDDPAAAPAIDLESVMSVLDQQENSHSLAPVLAWLHDLVQQGKRERAKREDP